MRGGRLEEEDKRQRRGEKMRRRRHCGRNLTPDKGNKRKKGAALHDYRPSRYRSGTLER